MTFRHLPRRAALIGLLVVSGLTSAALPALSAGTVLRKGSTGPAVTELQRSLATLGYLNGKADGVYGAATVHAVKAFQVANHLGCDGVLGLGTQSVLNATLSRPTTLQYTVRSGDSLWTVARKFHTTVSKLARQNHLAEQGVLEVGSRLTVLVDRPSTASRGHMAPSAYSRIQIWPWSRANSFIPVGSDYTVTDTRTGESFTARRIGGNWHLDSEPETVADVQMLKAVYGGAWSWDRRAVVVKYRGVSLAASMNGMPHGADEIPGNGFRGMFCIHFVGSRVHASGAVDPEHQAMIRRAAGYTGPLPQ